MTDAPDATVCLDASLATKLVLIEERSDLALRLWDGGLGAGTRVIAPALITWEVANSLRKTALGGRVPSHSVAPLYASFISLPVEFVPCNELPEVAWRQFVLGFELCVSPYDATYLATAQAAECDLWAADDRLMRTVGEQLPWVRALSEITAPE